jgi:hypothetical protein
MLKEFVICGAGYFYQAYKRLLASALNGPSAVWRNRKVTIIRREETVFKNTSWVISI